MSDQDDAQGSHPPITPRSSLGSGAISYSSGCSISPSTSSSGSQGSAKSAVSECLGAWLNYLQVMNSLCASGYRLAQTISALEQWGTGNAPSDQSTNPASGSLGVPPQTAPQPPLQNPNLQYVTAWDDLARATAVATSTVKSHIVGVLQDFVTGGQPFEPDADNQRAARDRNSQIIMETAQTMIHLQHQYCVASYDSFSPLMCCFICQAPVGYPHDSDCAIILQQQQQAPQVPFLPRSQTPSPHFQGPPTHSKSDYRMSSEAGHSSHGMEAATSSSGGRGPSPHAHHEIRGPSPIQGFLDTIRGPLPNPGHLLGMKAPFYRGSRSPLNYPLFPSLNGQRRWSEAAAGEVKESAESQMRRWSMPWEASKYDRTTVGWHQTRLMPVSKLAVPPMGGIASGGSGSIISGSTGHGGGGGGGNLTSSSSKCGSDRSQSTTPDSIWQSSVTSQDGLAEAIQLLSCRPSRMFTHQGGGIPPPPPPPMSFSASISQQPLPSLEEPPALPEQQSSQQMPPPVGALGVQQMAPYEMWSVQSSERLPCIKFARNQLDKGDGK